MEFFVCLFLFFVELFAWSSKDNEVRSFFCGYDFSQAPTELCVKDRCRPFKWNLMDTKFNAIPKTLSQHLLFRYSCLQPPWLLKYFFWGKHLLLKSLKTKKVFKKQILFSINRNLGSSDDDWIVTAAAKSLNKDTFQNYCVDCLKFSVALLLSVQGRHHISTCVLYTFTRWSNTQIHRLSISKISEFLVFFVYSWLSPHAYFSHGLSLQAHNCSLITEPSPPVWLAKAVVLASNALGSQDSHSHVTFWAESRGYYTIKAPRGNQLRSTQLVAPDLLCRSVHDI